MYDFEISCSGIMNHYHDSSTNLIILIFIVNILNYEGNLLIRGYYSLLHGVKSEVNISEVSILAHS